MDRTLVTGGLGYTGRVLVQKLISDGVRPVLILREEKINEAKRLFENEVITYSLDNFLDTSIEEICISNIFHLATFYEYSPNSTSVKKMIDSNIMLPTLIAEKVKSSENPPSWVNISTFMQHFEGNEYFPTSIYAATKQACEDVLAYFHLTKTLRVKTLVFPHIYGENDQRSKIINLIIKRAANNEIINLSSGNQSMDVLHVCDAVDAILHVAKFDEGRWRIGSLETFQIRDIVDLVSSATGKHLHVNYDRSIDRELDQFSSWHQGEVLPGFKRKIDFEDWITRAVFNN